jgi:hypothetical protein
MKEEPFESLARGLDKDLSSLLKTAELGGTKRNLQSPLAPSFGVTDFSFGRRSSSALSGRQAYSYSKDVFAQQLAIFPLADHVVINEFGAFIPQAILGSQTAIDYTEEQHHLVIRVSIQSKQHATETVIGSPLRRARPGTTIPKDDPIYEIGKAPVVCGVADASENFDNYLYGGE